MHRHHRDRGFGRIAAAEMLIGAVPLLLQAQVAQPVGRGQGGEPLAVHLLLHQLSRLLQIGQGPAPQREPRQPLGGEQFPQHPGEPQPRQLLPPVAQFAGQLIPALRRRRRDLRRRPAQQRRGRQQALPAGITGVRQRIEQPLQGGRTGTLEHVAAAHQPAGQLAPLQRCPQALGLTVAAHEQTQISRLQALFQQLLAQPGDLAVQLFGVHGEQLQRRLGFR